MTRAYSHRSGPPAHGEACPLDQNSALSAQRIRVGHADKAPGSGSGAPASASRSPPPAVGSNMLTSTSQSRCTAAARPGRAGRRTGQATRYRDAVRLRADDALRAATPCRLGDSLNSGDAPTRIARAKVRRVGTAIISGGAIAPPELMLIREPPSAGRLPCDRRSARGSPPAVRRASRSRRRPVRRH